MAIVFPTNPLHGQQYAPPGIPITWQFDTGRNAWRVVRTGSAWIDIVGKPSEFPPSEHDHPISDVTGLQDILNVKQDISARGQINGYAPLNEDGKVPENMLEFGAISWDNIPDKPAEFPPSPHTHPVADISDSGTTGQQVVRAPTQADARAAIGAIGIDDNARVQVEKNNVVIGVRRSINFKEGANVTLAVVDDPANEEVGVTVNSAGGGGGGSTLIVSEVKPASPLANDVWLDTATGIQFIYYNDGSTSQWIESIPYLDTMPGVFTKFDFPPAPIEGQTYNPIPGATWKWSATRGVWFAVSTTSGSYTKAESDAKFVELVGDVMTGPLSVVHPPTANTHAASKQYVDSKGGVVFSDTPPVGAADGTLWWESDTGMLYLRYNDGTSTQWVLAAPQPDFATYAPIVSPALTGNPTAPTPAAGDSDTSIATTAFVSASAVRYDSAQTLTAPQLLQARNNIYAAPFDAMAYGGMQINGGMEVSQESGYNSSQAVISWIYVCDGWLCFKAGTMAISSGMTNTASIAAGFPAQIYATVTTAQASLGAGDQVVFYQNIEGYRISRLAWGTSSAQPITISFWSRCARPGVYSVNVTNSPPTHTYATTFTHNTANVSQYNSITIPGPSVGTWAADHTVGMTVFFAMAAGSSQRAPSANTWLAGAYNAAPGQVNGVAATSDVYRLTGVTVHPGSQAPTAAQSPLITRPSHEELLTCKRYYLIYEYVYNQTIATLQAYSATHCNGMLMNYPQIRANPTVVLAPSLAEFALQPAGGGANGITGISIGSTATSAFFGYVSTGSGLVAGNAVQFFCSGVSGGWLALDARL